MAANYLLETAIQCIPIQNTSETKRTRYVVRGAVLIELFQEPQPLLGERWSQVAVAIDRHNWSVGHGGGSVGAKKFNNLGFSCLQLRSQFGVEDSFGSRASQTVILNRQLGVQTAQMGKKID